MVEVHRVATAWNEQNVTFNSFAGAFDPQVSASFATPAGGSTGFISFDATSLAKSWVKGPNYGLLLDEQGDRTRFKSSEEKHVVKRPRLEVCYLPPTSVPPEWTCDAARYGTEDGCDCNCGFADLDCFQQGQEVFGCGPDEVCSFEGTCKPSPPPEWTCAVDAYDSGGACNCECGAPDPDCGNPVASVVGCPDFTFLCSAEGHCEPTVCGDGIVSGFEGCDPPDGVTCSADCQIILPSETFCNDLNDDDQDGLYDCQDGDCQALGVCAPGTTPTGGPCASQTECVANANDPFCISEEFFGWSGGSCSEYCDFVNNDCSSDAVCVQVTLTAGLCFDGCASNVDCRAGYECVDFGGVFACAPPF